MDSGLSCAGSGRFDRGGANSCLYGTADIKVDPAAATEASKRGGLDKLVDHQLIELQTCAALITSALNRPEYARVSQ